MGQSLLSRAVSLMEGISEMDLRGLQLGWSRRSFLSVLTTEEVCSIFPAIYIVPQNTALEHVERCAFLTSVLLLYEGPALSLSLRPHPGRNHANVLNAQGEQPNRATLSFNSLQMSNNQLLSKFNFLYLFSL